MRRRAWIGAALAAVVLVGGGALVTGSLAAAGAPTPVATSSAPNAFAADGLQDPSTSAAEHTSDAVPVRVRIPRIGVDSSLEDLALGASGELQAPVDYDLAGWYSDGVVPGGIGPAIIAGHVDSPTAPAVFARIAELAPGDEVAVGMSDGTTLTFDITGHTQSAKASFPTADVYSNVPRPELRLITCAGSFDSSTNHYTDNLILFAALRG